MKFQLELITNEERLMRKDYNRHYINVSLRRNNASTPKAPQFIRHNITSPALQKHFQKCIEQNQPLSFDCSAFLDLEDNTAVITLSVPHQLSYKSSLNHFYECEESHEPI